MRIRSAPHFSASSTITSLGEPSTIIVSDDLSRQFLYIGMVDLAPILHHDSGLKKSILQLTGLLAGAGTIFLLHEVLD